MTKDQPTSYSNVNYNYLVIYLKYKILYESMNFYQLDYFYTHKEYFHLQYHMSLFQLKNQPLRNPFCLKKLMFIFFPQLH